MTKDTLTRNRAAIWAIAPPCTSGIDDPLSEILEKGVIAHLLTKILHSNGCIQVKLL